MFSGKLMDWLWATICGAFSGVVQGFLGLFGMSTAQKLGWAEVQNADLKAEVKAEQETIDAQNKVAGISNAAVESAAAARLELEKLTSAPVAQPILIGNKDVLTTCGVLNFSTCGHV